MARKAATTPAGLEQLEPEVREQLASLGYQPDRLHYSAAELVAGTKGGLMTLETFMHHAWTELPEQRAVA
jgi:hypothetical protein